MKVNDGGPAFPQSIFHDEIIDADSFVETKGGMALRDYFAAVALAAIIQRWPDPVEVVHDAQPDAAQAEKWLREEKCVACAKGAYAYADAMLAERQPGGAA